MSSDRVRGERGEDGSLVTVQAQTKLEPLCTDERMKDLMEKDNSAKG